MCAEELTNQVLYMRNIPPGEKDVWMTFEAIEEGELGKNKIHPYLHKHHFTLLFSTKMRRKQQSNQCGILHFFWK